MEGGEQPPDAAAPDASASGAEAQQGESVAEGVVEVAPDPGEGGQGEAGEVEGGDAPETERVSDAAAEATGVGDSAAVSGGTGDDPAAGGDNFGDNGQAESPAIAEGDQPEESVKDANDEGVGEQETTPEDGGEDAKPEEGGEKAKPVAIDEGIEGGHEAKPAAAAAVDQGVEEGGEEKPAAVNEGVEAEGDEKPGKGGEGANPDEAVEEAKSTEESAGAADEAHSEEVPAAAPPLSEEHAASIVEAQPAAAGGGSSAADEAAGSFTSEAVAEALDGGASSFACLPSVVSWSGTILREQHASRRGGGGGDGDAAADASGSVVSGDASDAAGSAAIASSAAVASAAEPVEKVAPEAATANGRDVSACAAGFSWVGVSGVEGVETSEEGSVGGLLGSSIAWTEGVAGIMGDEIRVEDTEGGANGSFVTVGEDTNNYADESFVSGPDTMREMSLGDLSVVQQAEETPKKKRANLGRQAASRPPMERKKQQQKQKQPVYCRVAATEASLRSSVVDAIEMMVNAASGTPMFYKLPDGVLGGGGGSAACAVLRGELVDMLEQLCLNRARVKADNPPPLQLLVGVCRSRCRDAALRASIEAQSLLDSSDLDLVDWFSGVAGAGAYVVGAAVLGAWAGKGDWEDVLARIKASVATLHTALPSFARLLFLSARFSLSYLPGFLFLSRGST